MLAELSAVLLAAAGMTLLDCKDPTDSVLYQWVTFLAASFLIANALYVARYM